MIKAVFFDIDNTLYDSNELAERARLNAIRAMIDAGLRVKNEKKVYKVLKGLIKEYGSNYDKHFDVLLERLEVEHDPEIIAAGVVAYHDTKFSFLKPFPDVVPVLLTLRDSGYRLGIISNGLVTKQWEKLIRMGLNHFFDVVVISGNEKGKPDRSLFLKAVAEMGCKPEEGVMVGDTVEKDVVGAKNAGMKTILVKKGIGRGRAKPDIRVKSLVEVPSAVKKLEKK